jgi:hypothetical protein
LLAGFSSVAKVSYIVAFLPGLVALVAWQRAFAVKLRHHGVDVQAWVSSAAQAMAVLAAGFVVAFGPNLFKNYVILGMPFASYPIDPYFSPATTRWLLLSYPFALTYGEYWAQAGTLSPLVLALAPLALFYLRKPDDWLSSRLLAVTMVAVTGLAAWLILFPSVITMRYFQVTTLMFGIPAAAGAEEAVRRSPILAWIVPAAVLVALAMTPAQSDRIVPTFSNYRAVLSAISGPHGPCSGSSPFRGDCAAQTAINSKAAPGDRVLVLTYLRYWLRPDLMRSMSTAAEVTQFLVCPARVCSVEEFWTRYRAARPGFRFIVHDSTTHILHDGTFESTPPGIQVRKMLSAGTTTAYEVTQESATLTSAGR